LTVIERIESYQQLCLRMAEAEHGPGWLAACAEGGQYLLLCREFVHALGSTLRSLGGGSVLEVAAGNGALATAMRLEGIPVIATDPDPPAAAESVETINAQRALDKYRPAVVIGSFVPQDAGVDDTVLAHHCVQHYLVLNAVCNQQSVMDTLARRARVKARWLKHVAPWMITRHDVWRGPDTPPLAKGEAWLLSRGGSAPER